MKIQIFVLQTFADHNATRYTYDVNGKLASRIWARGITTHYSYDPFGQLLSTTYSDSTPSTTNTYNALGNLSQVIDAKGTTVFTYNQYGNVISESIEGIYSKVLTKSYDSFGRNIGYELDNVRNASYVYDVNNGRFLEAYPGYVGGYYTFKYLENSHLLESLVTYAVTQSYQYEEKRDVITSVDHHKNEKHFSKYVYTNDRLGRRTNVTLSGTTFPDIKSIDFSYNARSEVIGETDSFLSQSITYDNIGNRIASKEKYSLRSFTTNALNQYTQIANTSVSKQAQQSRTLAPFVPTYDADGNATKVESASGIWDVTYNAENRPVKFTSYDAEITMNYDYMGRRFEKIYKEGREVKTHQRFVYNDYLQIAELSRENTLMRRYFWDPTAGMASRLLMIDDISLNRQLFLTHDANKNVTGLIEQSGNVAAHYEYHAFGFPTALSPFDSQAPSAQYETSYLNYFLFSSEFYDYELSMSYYNYRHYNPLDGRWLSRDPIEEIGGWNLYGMVNNNLVNSWDILGKDRYISAYILDLFRLHVGVAVDTWECKNGEWVKTGVVSFDFRIDMRSLWSWLSLGTVGVARIDETPGMYFNGPYQTISSKPCEDRRMLEEIRSQIKNNGFIYHIIGFNCQHWARMVISIGIKNPEDIFDWWNPLIPDDYSGDR